MWAITTLKLPDINAFKHWMAHQTGSSNALTATDTVEGSMVRKDEDAGMGRVRMALVKMGCRVNLDAPNTVSCWTHRERIKLILGMRNWCFDLLYPRRKQDSRTHGNADYGSVSYIHYTNKTDRRDQHMLINHDALT
jgi:hypothetical protein